jgi:O-antigen/teichoic acid export membrane protein
VAFGIILLFVIFEFGVLVAAVAVAQPILHALAWPAVLVGNILAALVMTVYFWRRHPHLTIEP